MTNKKTVIAALATTGLLIFLVQTNKNIEHSDACLCTEILSNQKFLDQKSKMPSVENCIDSFEDFENAHLKCIEMFEFEHPEIKKDSLKST
jgi:hypothetical protein